MAEYMLAVLLHLPPRQHKLSSLRFHRLFSQTPTLLSARSSLAVMASSETPINFYSGAPLNRLSWLRESATFLNIAALDSSTRWLIFNKELDPLMLTNPPGKNSAEETRKLAFLSTAQVKPLLGLDRLFGQGQSAASGDSISTDVIEPAEHPEQKILQAARLRGPRIVFLGVHEREDVKALPTGNFKSAKDLTGIPYFALDISKSDPADVEKLLQSASPSPSHKLEFQGSRPAAAWFDHFDAPIFSLGRSMVDWNARNRVGDFLCFYSTLAGFVEPSEAFEDSVKREIYEESGIKVRNVVYHSAQPWPYPANLMVGFYAIAEPNQEIRVDLDNELGDARWFTREEVLEVLAHPLGTTMGSSLNAKADTETEKLPPPAFRVPNKAQAIAGVLIHDWAHHKVPQLPRAVNNSSKI
ncbi:NADH pyrophosphatase [Tulasnella sp. UAMH 9824]|nr:NADH pyrophosphatase [Tulasnella sp. UAMH 9824]